MFAIGDSSPLILYASAGHLDLLREVFTEIIIPAAVWNEVVVEGHGRPGCEEVAHAPWIRQQAVTADEPTLTLLADLGPGESEAISLAMEFDRRLPVLIDDRKARRLARERGLRVLGSVGVLLLAKERQIIPSIVPALNDLRTCGLYLSVALVDGLLGAAGEPLSAPLNQ
jgi:predicted nucleic acid-binding protein